MSNSNHHSQQSYQQSPQHGQHSMIPDASNQVYSNPANLLSIYPFAVYQPTARAAGHIASHTITYPTPSSSSDLYPQYAEQFQSIDNPGTIEEWAMRNAVEAQMRERLAMAGPSYLHTPQSIQSTTSPVDQFGRTLALPYNYLPSYLPSPQQAREPPTPTSIADSAPSPSTTEYFEDFVNKTLRKDEPATPSHHRTSNRPRRPSPAASTPGLARSFAATNLRRSASPISSGLPGPSPTKKRKPYNPSPTLRPSQSLPGGPGQSLNGATNLKSPRKKVVEVVIPVRRNSSSHHKDAKEGDDESEEDDLDWDEQMKVDMDGDWDTGSGKGRASPEKGGRIMTGSILTGEKDPRSSFQRIHALFEDIFEASDSLPATPSSSDLSTNAFFSHLARDEITPLLSDRAIQQVIQAITRVQSGKRRQETEENTWDGEALGRLWRLLERVMSDVEGVAVFNDDIKVATKVEKPKKARGKKNGSKSQSPEDVKENLEVMVAMSEENLDLAETSMKRMKSAGIATECVLSLLDTEGLQKQLLSEDLLSTAVGVLRNQMKKVIFPVVEGLSGTATSSKYLNHILDLERTTKKGKSKSLSPLFVNPNLSAISRSLAASLPRLTSLIGRPDIAFSDGLVIQTVYLAVAPLFVVESGSAGKKSKAGKDGDGGGGSVMKSVRMEALGCLRGTFAKYEEQRQWIIEEILGSVVKVSDQSSAQTRFQLPNGFSIHIVSALLLQLVQASAYGVMARVKRLRTNITEMDPISGKPSETQLESAEDELRICSETIESASRSARIIAGYLIQRCSSSRSNKTSHDTDYKAILEIFVADLLNMLYRPEWPAASLFLNVMSRIMISALEDGKSGGDSSAAKGIALDCLGDIAAKLRGYHLAMQQGEMVPSLDEIISSANIDDPAKILQASSTISNFLMVSARDDGMYAGSREMTSVIWAQELQTAIKKSASVAEKLAGEKDIEGETTRDDLQIISTKLQSALRGIWMGEDDGFFEIKDNKQDELASRAAIAIARGRPLQGAFEPILHALVSTMDHPLIALRSKALRGLGTVVTIDPDVLSLSSVKQAIEDRLSDASPAVRDAAVELVGKYVVQKPDLATEYYPHIALRTTDPGLAVRKRVIKLLKGIFTTTESKDVKVDICCKMVGLIGDIDDNVKDLAVKTLTELIYLDSGEDSVGLLIEFVAEYRGTSSELERAFAEVAKECETSGQGGRAGKVVEALVARLVDGTEQTDFDHLGPIRAINLLCISNPAVIGINNAGVLVSYIRQTTTNTDEITSNDLILRILKRSIPHMPRAASTFAADLNKVLMPMISKPYGGLPAVAEIIGCFCVVANRLTRNYEHVMRVLRACESKARAIRDIFVKSGSTTGADTTAIQFMLYITALVAEHLDLDKIAETDDLVKIELGKITSLPLYTYLFNLYLDFARMGIPQASPSLCLGSLFKAYPVLILQDGAVEWMDGVFGGADVDMQGRLLCVIWEFLKSEAEKKGAAGVGTVTGGVVGGKVGGKGKKNMDALIGNTSDLSESGVSTAVVQRNIHHILSSAKSQHPPTQSAALEVLSFTVHQGLYHPLQCLPILIALETSEDELVASRAVELHGVLHGKHAGLVNVRFLDFARESYTYQRGISAEVVGYREDVALLQEWYALLCEKKGWKNDFLKAMVKGFDYDVSNKKQTNIGFTLYIADNLATFEYRLQEEIMGVVQMLSVVVSGCMPLVEVLEGGQVDGEGGERLEGKMIQVSQDGDSVRAEAVIGASIVVGIALLLKNHLVELYSLSEDKCLRHVMGKKSAMGDRPAVSRSGMVAALDTSRMPLVRGVETIEEFRQQQAVFLQLLHEDGTFGATS